MANNGETTLCTEKELNTDRLSEMTCTVSSGTLNPSIPIPANNEHLY